MKTRFARKRMLIFGAFVLGYILTCIFLIWKPRLLTEKSGLESQNIATNALAEERNLAELSPETVGSLGVLLVGYGGAGHEGGYLTDAIQMLHIDFERTLITLISIPRDLWVRSPGGGEMKINSVLVSNADSKVKDNYVKSGAAALKIVVAEITGLNVDYFVGVDFVGYQRAIGLTLDGIEVDVGETLDDPWYPIKGSELELCGMTPQEVEDVHAKYSGFELERQFTCRYKHLHFEKGMTKMEGEEALEYVRSRHGSTEGDVSRGKRQQEVLAAAKAKLFSLETWDDLPNLFNSLVTHTTTDIDLSIVQHLLPALRKAEEFKVTMINLSPANVLISAKSQNGAYIMQPKEGGHNWSEVKKFIRKK